MHLESLTAKERAILIYKTLISNLTSSDLMGMGAMRHCEDSTVYPDHIRIHYTIHILGGSSLPEKTNGMWSELCTQLLEEGIEPHQALRFTYKVPGSEREFVIYFNTDTIYHYCERNGLVHELEELGKQGFAVNLGQEADFSHIALDLQDAESEASSELTFNSELEDYTY